MRWSSYSTLAVSSCVAVSLAGSAGAQQAQAPPAIDPANLITERDGMVLVPAGEFKMGSLQSENWSGQDENPQRVVYLEAFYIDQLEVTNLQYKQFTDATGWPHPRDWHKGEYREGADFIPVTGVTWWDATAYARWAGKRLPTEAEWEKAARGTDGRRFPWGEEFDADHANNDRHLLPPGSKASGASPYGALDMAGNVAEWTASAYEPYPRPDAVLPAEFGGRRNPAPGRAAIRDASTLSARDSRLAVIVAKVKSSDARLKYFTPEELGDERQRVYRGGSYNSYAKFLRCANRESDVPGGRWDNVGFRCAADIGGDGDLSR